MMDEPKWKMRRLGFSRDHRTNRWEITPPCGHREFEPPTTMFGKQVVACPKCGLEALADYNEDSIG